jgi:hypothetical protein
VGVGVGVGDAAGVGVGVALIAGVGVGRGAAGFWACTENAATMKVSRIALNFVIIFSIEKRLVKTRTTRLDECGSMKVSVART